MKIGAVTGTHDSTMTIPANDIMQDHVTNFTKELFGYIANGLGDDISSIARTMLGEVVEKIDDWQIERFQQSFQDDKISFSIQTYQSEKYSMLSGMRVHILRRNNSYQFIVTINGKNYGCPLDNIEINWRSIVCFLNAMTEDGNMNDIVVTESYKPLWDWKTSQYNIFDIKFETVIKAHFSNRVYFSNCSPVDPTSTRPTYFGDTDGSVGAVLYALTATGHLGIMAEGENFLSQLLNIEDEVLNVLLKNNFNEELDTNVNTIISILNRRDIVLESLQPYLVINKGAVTPCTFLGDQTGDRFSNICGDQFIIDLLKRIMSINENVHVLAGNHETNCNGNYMQNFTRMKPLNEDTYAGIKDYPVCFYDPKYKIMANHHGITFDIQRERYILGPITVSKDEMTNVLDPVELAAIINKKHHTIINGKKFKISWAISCQSFNRYFSISTDYRPKLEALLACSQMLGINQVVAHNGNGGRELIGEMGAVLGLNARDSKHAGRMYSMHNCQINPGAGPEVTAPWTSYQHEKKRNELMPLSRRRTLLQL